MGELIRLPPRAAPCGLALSEASLEVRLEKLFQLCLVHYPDSLLHHLAAFEKNNGGNIHYGEFRGYLLGIVDVKLADFKLAFVSFGDGFHVRREQLARATPGRPKIEQDGKRRVQYFFFKIFSGYVRFHNNLPPLFFILYNTILPPNG